VQTPIGRGFRRWGQLLGILLVFDVLLVSALVGLYSWGVTTVVDAVRAGDIDTADTFDGLNVALSGAQLGGVLVTGVVWMTWQYQLARATNGLQRSPAMHAFSWIIPIGNIWLPIQNVRDLWKRTMPLRDTLVLGWWWAGWIGSAVIARLLRTDSEIDSVGDVRSMIWTLLVVAALALVTAVLALRIVRSLNRASWSSDAVSRAGSPAVL